MLVALRLAAHDRRDRGQPCEPGCAPPPLAGDELVSVHVAAHEDRLQHPVPANGIGKLTERLGVEARADLLSRYATAPRHVGSYSITDLPWLGASLMRTLRGIRVLSSSAG